MLLTSTWLGVSRLSFRMPLVQDTRIWCGCSESASGEMVDATKGVGITTRMTCEEDELIECRAVSPKELSLSP